MPGACEDEKTPEQQMLDQAEIEEVQAVVAALPEKYRMRKAKALLKEQLEAIGYDG